MTDDLDICACGDYRGQHAGGTGACSMPDDLTHGMQPCTAFRLAWARGTEEWVKVTCGRIWKEPRRLTCAHCRVTFVPVRSEGEAMADYVEAFPASFAARVPIQVVCDDCWQQLIKLQSPAQFEQEQREKN